MKEIIMSELISPQEAADYLGLSKVTVYKYIENGIIPAFKLGKSIWRIRTDDLFKITQGKKIQ